MAFPNRKSHFSLFLSALVYIYIYFYLASNNCAIPVGHRPGRVVRVPLQRPLDDEPRRVKDDRVV